MDMAVVNISGNSAETFCDRTHPSVPVRRIGQFQWCVRLKEDLPCKTTDRPVAAAARPRTAGGTAHAAR